MFVNDLVEFPIPQEIVAAQRTVALFSGPSPSMAAQKKVRVPLLPQVEDLIKRRPAQGLTGPEAPCHGVVVSAGKGVPLKFQAAADPRKSVVRSGQDLCQFPTRERIAGQASFRNQEQLAVHAQMVLQRETSSKE